MKYILAVLSLIVSLVCGAQDTTGNFISNNGSIIWEKTFKTSKLFPQIVSDIKRAQILNNIDTFENTIIGQSVEGFIDYKGAGFTTMNTPMYLSSCTYRAYVRIQYFDSAYTIRFTKIFFINQVDTKAVSPLLGSAQGETVPIEQMAIKKTGEFKKDFQIRSAAPRIIEYTFNKAASFSY